MTKSQASSTKQILSTNDPMSETQRAASILSIRALAFRICLVIGACDLVLRGSNVLKLNGPNPAPA
jgi:hypothetical protein